MGGIRIATNDGENVQDKTEEIREELLAGIVVGLGEDFEATHYEWAEGMFKCFETMMEGEAPEHQDEARTHFINLLQGVKQ